MTGSDILISGIVMPQAGDVVIRGLGPSLAQGGLTGVLANPTLELRDGNGTLIRNNNDWQDDPAQAAIITAAGLAPSNPLESGIAASLAPGVYRPDGRIERWNGDWLHPILHHTPLGPSPAVAKQKLTMVPVRHFQRAIRTAADQPSQQCDEIANPIGAFILHRQLFSKC